MLSVPIEVYAELVRVDHRGGAKCRDRGIARYKQLAAPWCQLADRHSVARHDKALTGVERPHDVAALVPKFALG